MYDAELTAFIRDIAIIVTTIAMTIAAVTLTVILLKLYGPARRGVVNFELASNLMLDTAARVSSVVNFGSDMALAVWNFLERIRSRGGRSQDTADPPPPPDTRH